MKKSPITGWARCVAWCCAALLSASVSAQTLTKIFDFGTTVNGPTDPYSAPILIGNELWFTTNAGGANDFGTITKFNLNSNSLTTVYSMDGTGNTPFSTLTQVGDYIYYTTSRGGTGDRGTISVLNTTNGENKILFNSPELASGLPYTFHGGVAYVDRGDGTASLYALHQSGGNDSAGGGVMKLTLNIAEQTATSQLIHTFLADGSSGRQPFEGFTRVGNNLYFTTQVGGTPVTGLGNGPGAIGKVNILDDAVDGAVALLQPGDGSLALPQNDLLYDPDTNALYFTTNGTATQPGSLQKFSLLDNSVTTLYELTNAPAAGPFPDGRFATGSLALVEGKLYFTTIQGPVTGGTNPNGGTINQFDLTTNTFTKLFDLDARTANNFGGEPRGGFLPVQDPITGEYDLYLLTKQGGVADQGTILKLHVVPEPGSGSFLLAGMAGLTAVWRRNRRYR